MDQYELSLIDNPPKKNPYFKLPDIKHIITAEEAAVFAEAAKSPFNSVVDIFGPSTRMTEEQSTQFLIQLLKHANFQPDYDAMADSLNIANGHHVKRRFGVILKEHGYEFDETNNAVVGDGKLPRGLKPPKRAKGRKIYKKIAVESTPKSASRIVAKRGTSNILKRKEANSVVSKSVKPKTRSTLGLVNSQVDLSENSEDMDGGADVEDNEEEDDDDD